ncbi:TPA: glucosamine-6-phosphate deaminase, partial [Haemophilus influenzae]
LKVKTVKYFTELEGAVAGTDYQDK